MRSWIEAAIRNTPAMNTLMVAILVGGTLSLAVMRREVFPEFDLDLVLVSVPYPGASPAEVEQGICQKIEEAVQSIDGIKKVTSVASEGAGSVVLELRSDVDDVQKVVSEVRSEVDRIPSFPVLAEDPEVQQVTMREPAIYVAVVAPENEKVDDLQIRAMAEQVRDELLLLERVSQVEILGARDYQIDVEISEEALRKHGLSLTEAAQIIRRENLEVPGGVLRGRGQDILLRGENKRLVGEEIAELPLITKPGGAVLSVADIGQVRDEFTDTTSISELNGRPALVLSITRTQTEDLLAMTEEVRQYVVERGMPGGFELIPWADRSTDVRERLDMLIENGIMGLILVFLVLSVFLELHLAFWVALGIPIALLGAGGTLLLGGQTLNMLSMFSFLMALGIVVDDAIVVGENIYEHRQRGKTTTQAAIDGTMEVLPSVVASITTTIIAFCSMFFVSGVMGKFIAVMPFAVIAMLLISLFECLFILPSHLAHRKNLIFKFFDVMLYPLRSLVTLFTWINDRSGSVLDWLVQRTYLPALRWSIHHRGVTVAAAVAFLLCTMGFVRAGFVPFIIFPKLDSYYLVGGVTFPDGTPASVADEATQKMVEGLQRVDDQLSGPARSFLKVVHRRVGSGPPGQNPGDAVSSGSHVGSIEAELVDSSERDVVSSEIIARWREETEEFAGADSVTYGSLSIGPSGTPIEFKLLAATPHVEQLEAAVEEVKAHLASYNGVFDVDDDSRPGKWEYRVRVKPAAQSLGVSTADVAETLRAAYYGEEVMRLQRGRHEVKLMVRYPEDERRSLANFEDIRVRAGDGVERPLTELAEIDVIRGYSEINRLNQMRSITISADVDESVGNARDTVLSMQAGFMPQLLQKYPDVQVRWEGQQEQTRESVQSLLTATAVALLIMFVLLTLEFNAYTQPLLILSIIPFGVIGAVLGHWLMNLPLTLFSFFGLVALTGVVVNDSIVLIDFINRRVRSGMDIDEALLDAGSRRFRPVLLTSVTTIAGLLPILIETSFQAQILIPMATSLAFGLLLATALVLILIPTFYRVYYSELPRSVQEKQAEMTTMTT